MSRVAHLFTTASCLCVLLPQAAVAQVSSRVDLPLTGTIIYNRVILDGGRADAMRFAGRIAYKLTSRTVIGFSVGSWATFQYRPNVDCGEGCRLVAREAEALIHQAYLQVYATVPVFVRVGGGFASTRTIVYPQQRVRARVLGSFGAGVDLQVAGHVFLSPSLDIVQLVGADVEGFELNRAFLAGIGLTVR